MDTGTGRVIWSVPIAGGVDGEARFDPARAQVYLGSDDGVFYAIDPQDGKIRWSYRGKGSVESRPEVGPALLYFTSAANRVVALEAATGKRRWQYDREAPEGFSIHGHAGPRLGGDVVYTGFDDGYLVALGAETGELRWARSLAAASDQFVDVDSTPVLHDDLVIAASYSGGLYALRAKRRRCGLAHGGGGCGCHPRRGEPTVRGVPSRRPGRGDDARTHRMATGPGPGRGSDSAPGSGPVSGFHRRPGWFVRAGSPRAVSSCRCSTRGAECVRRPSSTVSGARSTCSPIPELCTRCP